MRITKEADKFDIWLVASDWRYAAAIVGLSRYLQRYCEKGEDYEISDEYLKFRSLDITEERYLQFVEEEYGEDLPYKKLENVLEMEQITEDGIKYVNELLGKGNSIMKKVFGKLKFTGENREELQDIIKAHRSELTKETFRNKANMYANFANTGQLFAEGKACCRLLGYYVDGGRKTKSIAYNFDTSTFQSQDDPLFDFIPMAFCGDRDVFFINDNYSVNNLIATNRKFKHMIQAEVERSEGKSKDARKVLFKSIQEVADFIDFDTEVIVKDREAAFFETMYIRKQSIQILKEIKTYESFCFSIKVTDKYYINVQKKILDCILNLIRTDELIELLLKQPKENARTNSEYVISVLIEINTLICGGEKDMKRSMNGAYACAKGVVKKLQKEHKENKIQSYRQKLTSSIVFKDYDRCCQILLQLSNYTEVPFNFAYDLFEDFEKNKDIAYTFINALTKEDKEESKKEK